MHAERRTEVEKGSAAMTLHAQPANIAAQPAWSFCLDLCLLISFSAFLA